MKLSKMISGCFTGQASNEARKGPVAGRGADRLQTPRTSVIVDMLNGRGQSAPHAPVKAKPAPRSGLQRLIKTIRPARADRRNESGVAEGADARTAGAASRPSFELRLDSGKVRVRPRDPSISREQARWLERELNDKQNRVTSVVWSDDSRGYTISYDKGGVRRWVGTMGPAMPVVALTPHHATADLSVPPPVGPIAGLSGSADGGMWRVHDGRLYRWDTRGAAWKHVDASIGERGKIELMGRQLDGHAWVRCGSVLMKLGAEGIEERHQLRDGGRYSSLVIGPAGERLALDREGRLCHPDEPGGMPRSISLQLADGRDAFDTVALGKADEPVRRAHAVDFQLAPGGKIMFVRDRAGHLYQADLSAPAGRPGPIVARRISNPLNASDIREGWRTDVLALGPRAGSGTPVLHAVFSSSNGQRLTAVWNGEQWKPQYHVEQPLLLLNDRGIEDPDMEKMLEYGNEAALGIARDGHVYTKDGRFGWQPLLTADGQPVTDVVDLKLGPSGLSDGKSVYARQQGRDGSSRILGLELGGKLANLPARAGGGGAALPTNRHLVLANVLAASAAPMLDFAVDGKGVAYHVAGDRSVLRTAPGAQPEQLPPLPGRARVQQIAVSSDGNQLFALARGALVHGDAERMPTLFRFDGKRREWINCRINVSWDDPLHLSVSNVGTLQLAVEKPDGTRAMHRVLPPIGGRDAYRLQAMAPGEAPVTKTVTDERGKRVRIPGTGAFATLSHTRGGVAERGKGRFSAALGHVERVLTMSGGAARRVREQRNGRDDMAAEYGAMRAIHNDIEQLIAGAHFPLPPRTISRAFGASAVGDAVVQACASLRDDALGAMTAELRRIGVRAGVWGPDFRVTANAERRKQTAAATPDANDLLPRMIDWLTELTARAEADAERVLAERASGVNPVFSTQELDRMRQVLALMRQLREQGVKLPAADPSQRRDNGHDMAVLTGAIARHLLTLERATRIVTMPGGAGEAAPGAAVEALKHQVADDKVLRLARFGFGGWEDAEAHWEVIESFRQEVAKPRAPLARKLKESLAIENVRATDEVAVKLAEAMKGLSNRSTLFGIESRGASVGATASGALFTRAGAWGFATLGIDRTTMVGVERTADQLAEGPLVAFFVRQSAKSVAAGSGFGLDFKPLNRVLGTRVQAQLQGSAGVMHGKGAAMLVEPEVIDEFCRRLCDPAEDPGRVLELGINGGAIGLDMRETQMALGATVGGLGGYADKIPAFGPPAGNAAHAFQQTGLQRGFVGGGVNWTARDFLLKLQHAWEPISGYEYQGGSGWTANAFASLVEQGGLLPHVSDAFSLALRSLNITLEGAMVEWSGVESFKRTLDWQTATQVEPKAWQDLAAQAKATFPSQVMGHLNGVGFKEVIAANLEAARTTWGARSEHERAAFVNRAEQMLLQDALAERGRAMLLPGAKIEINIPNVGALEDGRKGSSAHRSLGGVMESSLHAREAIPGLANAMRAMAKLEGTNDTRFVFQMDPAFINAVNRQMLEGTLSWEELNTLARTMPAPYRLTEICAKNSDANRSAFSFNPLPVVAFNDSAEASQSLFTAEAHLRYGLDGRIVGCDLLPGAQRAVGDQPLFRAFAREGVHPVRADARPLPPQRPDLPKLLRSQSESAERGESTRTKPFSSSLS